MSIIKSEGNQQVDIKLTFSEVQQTVVIKLILIKFLIEDHHHKNELSDTRI